MKKIILPLLTGILIVLSACMIIFSSITLPFVVDGDSMFSTLKEGEEGYALSTFKERDIKRFSIIIFDRDNKKVVKRVIGLPGETVQYREGKLYINNELVEESYLDEGENMCTCQVPSTPFCTSSVTLKDSEYYVMGDNRDISYDSRYYGPINFEDIDAIAFIITKSSDNKMRFIK